MGAEIIEYIEAHEALALIDVDKKIESETCRASLFFSFGLEKSKYRCVCKDISRHNKI